MKQKRGLANLIIIGAVLVLILMLLIGYVYINQPEDIESNSSDLTAYNEVSVSASKLAWPMESEVFSSSTMFYPDIDGDRKGFNCNAVNYVKHEGTDINLNSYYMQRNVSVLAALDGQVLWVFDGKYDKCPNTRYKDCDAQKEEDVPGLSSGYRVCTDMGQYCEKGEGYCFWCFDGGNVIVIRHYNNSEIFATRYDHLKNGSMLVKPGDFVKRGQKIAEVGSSGKSLQPHLHFEVWGAEFYKPVDPWAGECGPNFNNSLWENQLIK